MNILSGTLLLSFALLLASNVHAGTTTVTASTSTESSETAESTISKNSETLIIKMGESAETLSKEQQEEGAEVITKTESSAETSDTTKPSGDTMMEGHDDTTTEETKPAEAVNYDDIEDEPDEDSCD